MRRETEDRQQRDRERHRWRVLEESPVSTCTAGGKMSLLMDPSFLQHLEKPRPAKGIKYGIIIIILQLSIIPSLSLSLTYFHCLSFFITQMHTHSRRLTHTSLIFPWSIRWIYGGRNTSRHVFGQQRKITNYMHTHTQNPQFSTHWDSCPTVQSVHDDRRICVL